MCGFILWLKIEKYDLKKLKMYPDMTWKNLYLSYKYKNIILDKILG